MSYAYSRMATNHDDRSLRPDDSLIIVDVQNDFLPGGPLAVPEGDRVVPVLNRYIARFSDRGLSIVATRDWHPPNHCSFRSQGGPWPPHCVAGTAGAALARQLHLPKTAIIISKATQAARDAYSGFAGTDLEAYLRGLGTKRLFVGGLATDYCVLNTVLDALQAGFRVMLLGDAVRAVDLNPDDGARAAETMRNQGAEVVMLSDLV